MDRRIAVKLNFENGYVTFAWDSRLRDHNYLLPSNYHTLSYIGFDLATDELGNRFRHCRLFVAKLEGLLKLEKILLA